MSHLLAVEESMGCKTLEGFIFSWLYQYIGFWTNSWTIHFVKPLAFPSCSVFLQSVAFVPETYSNQYLIEPEEHAYPTLS